MMRKQQQPAWLCGLLLAFAPITHAETVNFNPTPTSDNSNFSPECVVSYRMEGRTFKFEFADERLSFAYYERWICGMGFEAATTGMTELEAQQWWRDSNRIKEQRIAIESFGTATPTNIQPFIDYLLSEAQTIQHSSIRKLSISPAMVAENRGHDITIEYQPGTKDEHGIDVVKHPPSIGLWFECPSAIGETLSVE